MQSGMEAGMSGAKVIDSSHREGALSGVNDLMSIYQEPDAGKYFLDLRRISEVGYSASMLVSHF